MNIASGNLSYEAKDISYNSRGINIEFTRYYSSLDRTEGPLGYGWSHSFDITLTPVADTSADGVTYHVIRHMPNKSNDKFTLQIDGKYKSPTGCYDKLFKYNSDIMLPLSGNRLSAGYAILDKHGTYYLFSLAGMLYAIRDRNNNQINLYYDSNNRLIKIIDTVGRETTVTYNNINKIGSITDHSGRKTVYSYDGKYNLVSAALPSTPEYPNGTTTMYSYDDRHQLISVCDARGNTFLQNKYDAQGRVTEQYNNNALSKFIYAEKKTTIINPHGVQTEYSLNDDGSTASQTINTTSGGSATSFTTSFEYNTNKEVTKVTLPKGNSKVIAYDENGNILSVTMKPPAGVLANDITTLFTYETSFSQVKTITDPKGCQTTFDYDAKGNLISVAYPTVNAVAATISMTYNQYGQLVSMTNAKGAVSRCEYNALGQPSKVILDYGDSAHANATYSFGYDQWGHISSVVDANNHDLHQYYNALNWLTKRTLGNETTRYSYDANGNLTRIEKKADLAGTNWQITDYAYDAMDRLIGIKEWISDTESVQSSRTYDSLGNITQTVDAENHSCTFSYDDRNLITSVADAQGNTTGYSYDANGNVASVMDAKGNVTVYQYDGFDRLTRTTYPDDSYEEVSYDTSGNLTSKRTRKGDVIQYGYDALNRLTQKTYPGNSAVNYSYDIAGRLTGIMGAGSAQSYSYDALNRITQALMTVNNSTYTVGYAYDKVGNNTQITYPDNSLINYTYDASNRLLSIKDIANNNITSYQYDPLLRRTSASFGNTTSASYTYDTLNRILSIVGPGGTRGYSYDNIGNALTMTGPEGSHGYSYDSIYQLTSVTHPSGYFAPSNNWSFDQLGNRTSDSINTFTTNNLNQYTSIGQNFLSYDANGNLMYDIAGSSYTYDCENRLIRVENSTMTAVYGYDPSGRRISKTINGVTTYYIYDGGNVIAEYDSTGSLERKYVFGQQIDEPVMLVCGTEKYYYHVDRLGSITELTDSTGAVLERYRYDAYGNIQVTNANNEVISQSAIGNRFGFTGREIDWETGLYYYRARYYDPRLGRFLQADPIGYYDSENLYQYCGNNPSNLIDPLGLFSLGDDPGDWDLVPLVGPALDAMHDFKEGETGWGVVNTGMAISDAFLLKAAGTGLVRGAFKLAGSHSWGATRRWLGKRGWAEAGQHVHHWLIPRGNWGSVFPNWLKNQPWNLMAMKSTELHYMLHGSDLNLFAKWFKGTPTWSKAFLFSSSMRGTNDMFGNNKELKKKR